jgi:IclR family acetate operon transcriptional repressor
MNTEKNDTSTIKSVDKALEVLEAFSSIHNGINLSSLSRDLNMNKSHVFRLLQVFKQRGYVEQTRKNGKYHLGRTSYILGQNIVSNMDLLNKVKPDMEKLVEACNETVYLALRFGDETLLIDSVECRLPVSVMPLKGRSYPLTACAAGEIFLAYDVEANESVDSCTLTARDAQLAAIKQQGYSADIHCLGEGICSLVVPILDVSKSIVGSLCFVVPEFRFRDEKVNGNLLAHLKAAGQVISARLGYPVYRLG